MPKQRFEEMLPSELDTLVRRRPLAWIPVGTLEWHGRHLPVGLDALKAHALCLRFAERAGGVVLPVSYHSMDGMLFPWTFRHGPGVPAATVLTTLRGLHRRGFKVMFIITGHYPVSQTALLIAVAHVFMAARDAAVIAAPEFAAAMEAGYRGDHAAKWETSIMMELFPKLVDREQLAALKGKRGLSLAREGVMGINPAGAASRDEGKRIIEVMTGNFAALAERLLENPDRNAARAFHREFIRKFIAAGLDRFATRRAH